MKIFRNLLEKRYKLMTEMGLCPFTQKNYDSLTDMHYTDPFFRAVTVCQIRNNFSEVMTMLSFPCGQVYI